MHDTESDTHTAVISDIFGNDKVAYVECKAEDGTEVLNEEEELDLYIGNQKLTPTADELDPANFFG